MINNCLIHDGFSVYKEMIQITELSEVYMKNITVHDIYSHKEVIILIQLYIT